MMSAFERIDCGGSWKFRRAILPQRDVFFLEGPRFDGCWLVAKAASHGGTSDWSGWMTRRVCELKSASGGAGDLASTEDAVEKIIRRRRATGDCDARAQEDMRVWIGRCARKPRYGKDRIATQSFALFVQALESDGTSRKNRRCLRSRWDWAIWCAFSGEHAVSIAAELVADCGGMRWPPRNTKEIRRHTCAHLEKRASVQGKQCSQQ